MLASETPTSESIQFDPRFVGVHINSTENRFVHSGIATAAHFEVFFETADAAFSAACVRR